MESLLVKDFCGLCTGWPELSFCCCSGFGGYSWGQRWSPESDDSEDEFTDAFY